MKLSLALGVTGSATVAAGVYLLLGLGAALIAVGLPIAAIGVLRET
jgi:hypothetical protein